MKRKFLWVTCILLLFSITIISWKADKIKHTHQAHSFKFKAAAYNATSARDFFSGYIDEVYNTAQLHAAGLDYNVFEKAITGYFNLKAANMIPQTSSVITIVDLAKSSCSKRMWIVDLMDKNLLIHTWVAHGNGSGGDVPDYFSNSTDSHASSIGFYVTNGIYYGKHGRSLKLDGVDAGFNDNARSRGIVVHGAQYVSQGTINALGRLGKSEGCPAVSTKMISKVIGAIKGNTVLYINGKDYGYSSKYLDEDAAAKYVYPVSTGNPSMNASL